MAERKDPVYDQFELVLLQDVLAALCRFESEPRSQQNRRDLVRTLFASIEGFMWIFREEVSEAADTLGKLSMEERFALSELSYHVTSDGKITSQSRFVPLPAVFRLTCRLAERINSNFSCQFAGGEWAGFKKAIAIRNRVTHPKSVSDIDLSETEVATCVSALFWLLEQITEGLETTNEALRVYVKEFAQLLEKLKHGDPATLEVYQAARQRLLNE